MSQSADSPRRAAAEDAAGPDDVAPPPPVVTPDEVTQANAAEKAQALRENWISPPRNVRASSTAKEITTNP